MISGEVVGFDAQGYPIVKLDRRSVPVSCRILQSPYHLGTGGTAPTSVAGAPAHSHTVTLATFVARDGPTPGTQVVVEADEHRSTEFYIVGIKR